MVEPKVPDFYKRPRGLLALPLLGAVTFGAATAQAQLRVPEAGTIGAGSFPSERAAAAIAANGGTAPPRSLAPAVRLNAQGFPVGLPPGEPEVDSRRFRFTPSLGGTVIATDNVDDTPRNRKADLLTVLSPGILVSADTPRLAALLSYQPSAVFYARESDQNRINHIGNGQMVATLIPEALFLDIRGSASIQPVLGRQASESGSLAGRSGQVQSISYLISPYYVQRFGSLATARIGYSMQYGRQGLSNSDAADRVAGTNLTAAQLGFANNEFTAHQVYAVIRSGPDFGRFAFEAGLDSTDYVGTGVLDGAYRRLASLEGRYAVTRDLFVLAEGGYESQRYAGTPGLQISGPIYSIGLRYNILEDGFIIARYGRRDGFNSASLDASVPVGGRTRVVARYSERLTTTAGRTSDLLATTTLDELGNPIDLATGLPATTGFTGSILGVQSSLFRSRTATASIVQSWPRDVFALTVSQEEQTPLSVVQGVISNPQKATSGSFVWSHSLTERTASTAFLQFGRFESGVLGNGTFGSVSLSLQHEFQPRLSGTIQLATTVRSNEQGSGRNEQGSGRSVQNRLLLSLRQTF
jgi:uncharacterized protein (PEP-CTERM system associated)